MEGRGKICDEDGEDIEAAAVMCAFLNLTKLTHAKGLAVWSLPCV